MNTIEQQLWDYIDGNLNDIQRKNIEEIIEKDAAVKLQYQELLNLNLAFSELELDEPSMSFTRNVMESVAFEPAPISLKTKVDTRIIFGIGGFFVFSILSLLGYILYNSSFSVPDFGKYFTTGFDLDKYITPTAMYVFIGFDIVIGLIFMDYILRRKLNNKD